MNPCSTPIRPSVTKKIRRAILLFASLLPISAAAGEVSLARLTQLLARKPFRVVAVALANKMARIAWALLAKGGLYRAPALAAAA